MCVHKLYFNNLTTNFNKITNDLKDKCFHICHSKKQVFKSLLFNREIRIVGEKKKGSDKVNSKTWGSHLWIIHNI